jgi:streptogramin lyase
MEKVTKAPNGITTINPLHVVRCALVLTLTLSPACARKSDTTERQAAAPALVRMTIADTTFHTPESVLYDPTADVYLVSNINGTPLEEDNNGFICRVSSDGRVLDGHWIAARVNGVTLNAPKGMTVRGDTLFVADIDHVRVFNRTTGSPLASWPVPGATFLNDMATGPDGAVYVTDSGLTATFGESGTDALYRIGPAGEVVAVIKAPSLGHPNGIVVDPAGVVVVTFGSGEVYRIDPATGARTDLPKPPKGQLDGVAHLADGSLLLSSWEGEAVYRLDTAGMYTTVVDSVTSPADFGLDTQRGRVLIPSFMQDKIEVREIK